MINRGVEVVSGHSRYQRAPDNDKSPVIWESVEIIITVDDPGPGTLPDNIREMTADQIVGELRQLDAVQLERLQGLPLDPRRIKEIRHIIFRRRHQLLKAGFTEHEVALLNIKYFESLEFEPGRKVADVARYWDEMRVWGAERERLRSLIDDDEQPIQRQLEAQRALEHWMTRKPVHP